MPSGILPVGDQGDLFPDDTWPVGGDLGDSPRIPSLFAHLIAHLTWPLSFLFFFLRSPHRSPHLTTLFPLFFFFFFLYPKSDRQFKTTAATTDRVTVVSDAQKCQLLRQGMRMGKPQFHIIKGSREFLFLTQPNMTTESKSIAQKLHYASRNSLRIRKNHGRIFEIQRRKERMEKSLEEDANFGKLPDDVLGLILTKLSDPKDLLRCYLVSKHFALIQSQSQSLSLQLPSSHLIPSHLLPPQYPNPFTTEPPLQQSLMFDSFFDNRLLWLTKLVSRFTSLRSLHIQLSCECPQLPFAPDHRFSWDFKVGHSLNTFAILSNLSIKKIDEEGSESEEPGSNSLWNEHYLNWQTTCSMYYANSIYPLLLLLVSRHPNIDSVEIMDSKKHGKVSLQGEQLTKLKSKSKLSHNIFEQKENSDNLVPGYYFTLWYVPELRLPWSGFAMKRVTLGVGAKNMFPSNIDDGTKESANDFGDDVFGEALKEILTNHYVSGRMLDFRLSSRKP